MLCSFDLTQNFHRTLSGCVSHDAKLSANPQLYIGQGLNEESQRLNIVLSSGFTYLFYSTEMSTWINY